MTTARLEIIDEDVANEVKVKCSLAILFNFLLWYSGEAILKTK